MGAVLFVDPVADIALLVAPDNQAFYEQSAAFDDLVDNVIPFEVTDAPEMVSERKEIGDGIVIENKEPGEGEALVLALDGKWVPVTVGRHRKALAIDPAGVIDGGMSGSPILSGDGKAIGIVSTDGTHPILWEDLPAWFFR